MEPKYKRVIMKISGEALCSEKNHPLDFEIVGNVADQIIAIAQQGVEVGIIAVSYTHLALLRRIPKLW